MARINISNLGIRLSEAEVFDQIGLLLKDKIGGTGRFHNYKVYGDTVYNEPSTLAAPLSTDEGVVKVVQLANELQEELYKLRG